MISLPNLCVTWGPMANLFLNGPSAAMARLLILVVLLPVAGGLVAKLIRYVFVFLPGGSMVVMVKGFCFILIWEVLLFITLMALGLGACNMMAELDCDRLLVLFLIPKAMVNMSGDLVPVLSG
jgi:hypothetical protein